MAHTSSPPKARWAQRKPTSATVTMSITHKSVLYRRARAVVNLEGKRWLWYQAFSTD